MPTNKRSKYRGSRTCGGGTHKNRRGAGNRGGRGRAGINAHHFVRWYMEMGRPVFGKDGFTCSQSKTVTTIDIGVLDQLAPSLLEYGLAEKVGDLHHIDVKDLGIEKVLGSGRVTKKLDITAQSFSEKAKSKIEALGGNVHTV